MVRILVDSAADFEKEELAAHKIKMVPLTITVDGDKSYRDELELTRTELYELLLEGNHTVKTSQPSPDAFLKEFLNAKDAGDDVICIMLSSALSGTYRSAVLAQEMAEYDRIHVIDSLSATAGVQFMAVHAQKLAAKGMPAAEIVTVLEEVKSRIRIFAVVDTLKYLYLGGRVSKTTAVVADTINIKPSITVTVDGKVAVGSKYLGISRAVKDLVRHLKEAHVDPEFPVKLVFSHNRDNVNKLQKAMTDAGVHTDGIYELGSTLGVHVGPGAFGLIYIEK